MAIKIKNLEAISKEYEQKAYIFKDLHLDFEKSYEFNSSLNMRVDGNDVRVDYDESAIRNSLRNLFNTKPGQRFLFPLYGLDLSQYLFEPVSEFNGQLIGEKIVSSIKKYEPRVTLLECNIEARPDDNEYDITIIISIPAFNTTASINTLLDVKTQTFIFAENSRNR